MKSTAKLGTATRTVGKLFFALTLLLVAIAAGFGGTALIVYHQLDGGRAPVARNQAERKAVGPTQDKSLAVNGTRQVAAGPTDLPSYTFADNNGGQPSTPSKRVRTGVSVPAPLENAASQVETPNPASGLNDPESRYIVDSRTGLVVGIDGSVGARKEEDEEQRRLQSAPRAVAVQAPVPEVRVASAVVEEGQSISATGLGSQYLPVRRALPVTTDVASVESGNFNAAEYMAGGQSRPVLRAQPVNVNTDRVARTTRAYRLSDDSRFVTAD